jgi:hypothetical protein
MVLYGAEPSGSGAGAFKPDFLCAVLPESKNKLKKKLY